MRAVVDESVPRQVVPELLALGHRINSFPNEWKGLKNGSLIARLRSDGFQILVTCDKNFQHQQNIQRSQLALIVLPSPFMPELLPLLEKVADALSSIATGQIVKIDSAP